MPRNCRDASGAASNSLRNSSRPSRRSAGCGRGASFRPGEIGDRDHRYLATKISFPPAEVRAVSLGSPWPNVAVPPEQPGHVAVAALGGRDADAFVDAAAAGSGGPEKRAVRVVFGNEDIASSSRGMASADLVQIKGLG
jgi:hypothetical protein